LLLRIASWVRVGRTGLDRWRLPWPLVTLLDVAVCLLIALALVVDSSGGVRTRIVGVLFTASSVFRPLAAAAILLLIRALFARHRGPFGSPAGAWRRLISPTADAVPMGGVTQPGRALALASFGYVVAVGVMLHTQIAQMHSVPDLGDPLFSMWRMGWVYLQVLGDPRGLFDANIFHPEPLTLTYSDSMLLTSLEAVPLLAAGVPRAVTYNLLMLSGFFFSAVATYLLVARITGSVRAAFIAGLLYGFHPFRFEHYSHLELQMTHWMPLALWGLHRFLDTYRLRDALLFGGCLVAQLYSSMYYGVFFPFYVGTILATLLIVTRPPLRRLAGPMAVAGVLALAMAYPLSRPYNAAQAVKGDRPPNEVQAYSAQPADYLRPHFRSAVYARRLLPEVHGERALFPGAMMIVLSLAALIPPIGTLRVAYAAALVVGLDMSMGLNGLVYPYLYEWFSPIRGMRVPARFSIILGISLVVLSAFSVRALLARLRTEVARQIAFGVLIVLTMLDLRAVLELEPVWETPPAVYRAIEGQQGVVLAEFPMIIDGSIDALPQMYFSTWHGRPMVNGYSGFFPGSYEALFEAVSVFPSAEGLALLRDRGVTHVVVNCGLMRDVDGCDALIERIDASPTFRPVASVRWQQGRPVQLYQLLP
jgi:hypothetical protein